VHTRPVSFRPEQIFEVILSALSRREVRSVAEVASGKACETDMPKTMPERTSAHAQLDGRQPCWRCDWFWRLSIVGEN
jgi:hypothetical protein